MNNDFGFFTRSQYSPISVTALGGREDLYAEVYGDPEVNFSGGEVTLFFGSIRAGRCNSLQYQLQRDMAQTHEMGTPQSKGTVKGKRVGVGSMVFDMADSHAILEGILRLSASGERTVKDLWSTNSSAALYAAKAYSNAVPISSSTVSTKAISIDISDASFAAQTERSIARVANLTGAEKIVYVDQLPPVDITCVGVKPTGEISVCTFFGVEFGQEMGGWTMADLTSVQGFNFSFKHLDPWKRVRKNSGTGVGVGRSSG